MYKAGKLFSLLGISISLLQLNFSQVVNAQSVSNSEICSIYCLSETTGVKQIYSRNIFKGTWNTEGYRCLPRIYHREVINIQVNENSLVAIKLDSDGDSCVPTGSVTFSASVPNEVAVGVPFPITFVAGTPDNPASTAIPGQIIIVDENTFYAESTSGERITFWRVPRN